MLGCLPWLGSKGCALLGWEQTLLLWSNVRIDSHQANVSGGRFLCLPCFKAKLAHGIYSCSRTFKKGTRSSWTWPLGTAKDGRHLPSSPCHGATFLFVSPHPSASLSRDLLLKLVCATFLRSHNCARFGGFPSWTSPAFPLLFWDSHLVAKSPWLPPSPGKLVLLRLLARKLGRSSLLPSLEPLWLPI